MPFPHLYPAVFFHFCSSLASLWLQKVMTSPHLRLAPEEEVMVICFWSQQRSSRPLTTVTEFPQPTSFEKDRPVFRSTSFEKESSSSFKIPFPCSVSILCWFQFHHKALPARQGWAYSTRNHSPFQYAASWTTNVRQSKPVVGKDPVIHLSCMLQYCALTRTILSRLWGQFHSAMNSSARTRINHVS